jgi:lysophospholipase L1-like esterase
MNEHSRPFTVVCLGDSITGYRPRQPYRDQYLKYSDLLELMLAARPGVGAVRVLNRGWAGDTTEAQQGTPGAAQRLDGDVLAESPDVVTVLLGINDRPGCEDGWQRTASSLTAIVRRLQDAGIRVLLVQYHDPLPAQEGAAGVWPDRTRLNDLIADVGLQCGVPVLDIRPAMREAARVQPRGELVDPDDGTHLRPGGEIVFARAMYRMLDELGWIPKGNV